MQSLKYEDLAEILYGSYEPGVGFTSQQGLLYQLLTNVLVSSALTVGYIHQLQGEQKDFVHIRVIENLHTIIIFIGLCYLWLGASGSRLHALLENTNGVCALMASLLFTPSRYEVRYDGCMLCLPLTLKIISVPRALQLPSGYLITDGVFETETCDPCEFARVLCRESSSNSQTQLYIWKDLQV